MRNHYDNWENRFAAILVPASEDCGDIFGAFDHDQRTAVAGYKDRA
jgi:hypothetical protein